jgi:hypothetical protein
MFMTSMSRRLLLLACVGCTELAPPPSHPSPPSQPIAMAPPASQHTELASCEVRFPVKRRCISKDVSPGEPYMLADARGLEVIFRVAVGDPHSWTRSERHADRFAIDNRELGARIRDDITRRDELFVPCERLPPDGTYWIDLCFNDVPAAQCASSVPATGVGLFTITRAKEIDRGTPSISMMASANDGSVLVSFSPDVTDPRCDR